MDACSVNELRLGKDSPSNKLLFAKDITHYRSLVATFYNNVRNLPSVSDQQLAITMTEMSKVTIIIEFGYYKWYYFRLMLRNLMYYRLYVNC
jgi:hypothetical protein